MQGAQQDEFQHATTRQDVTPALPCLLYYKVQLIHKATPPLNVPLNY